MRLSGIVGSPSMIVGEVPSLSTSGETLTIEESTTPEGQNGDTPGFWRCRAVVPAAAERSEPEASGL
jgi:hypothetical protein